jgi:hypothetical protein
MGTVSQTDLNFDHITGDHATGRVQHVKVALSLRPRRVKGPLHTQWTPVTSVLQARTPKLAIQLKFKACTPAAAGDSGQWILFCVFSNHSNLIRHRIKQDLCLPVTHGG